MLYLKVFNAKPLKTFLFSAIFIETTYKLT